ncbi:undecaprenyl-diphosphatase [Pandoraea terrae]|uniref:Undecaprenyl-diphosphatase n=1 Tax=Pandoraea terrae TaxID=1537710 RepID=A0A5E4RB54_9BURK|nr:phosphatase PAP2 family protein [Pandoraea terrae]VVD60427.1 undecaprenyl-diphosphatase [Pandoraea terrae]
MENLNRALFLWINASSSASPGEIAVAVFCAKYLIALVPLGLIALWFAGGRDRESAVHGLIGLALALAISGLTGLLWPEPRPFVAGLGTQWLAHAPTPAFPSNHGTIMFTAAFVLMNTIARSPRLLGRLLLLCAFPVAWARIYLGVHWPVDMAGGFAVALVVALIMRMTAARETSRVACAILEGIYRGVMAWPISRGWLRR